MTDKPSRRQTLRQLLTHAEKTNRDLIEHFRGVLVARLSEFRDLSRPVRRRSNYPTMMALQNSLLKLEEGKQEIQALHSTLEQQLAEILEYAKREQANRPIP